MNKVQSTKPLPPPAGEHVSRLDEQGGGVTIVVFLLGLVAWFGAWAMIISAKDQDTPTENYAFGDALTIVGATLLICATIYDSRHR